MLKLFKSFLRGDYRRQIVPAKWIDLPVTAD
jgi:hypothetical protein